MSSENFLDLFDSDEGNHLLIHCRIILKVLISNICSSRYQSFMVITKLNQSDSAS